jgi:hypothetical protein
MAVPRSILSYPIQRRHMDLQAALLPFTIVIACIFLATRVTDALLVSLFLLLFVAAAGLWMITRLSRQLEDGHLQKLGYVFLCKLLLVVFVLYAGWAPQLESAFASYGYDPQRYYFDAHALMQSRFDLWAMPSLNYTGILLYYGLIFAMFGHNPIIPALVNTFVTLLATLLLVRVGYQIKRDRGPRDWQLGLAMLIPEVLWFDVMTSRETIVMALIVFTTISMGGYFIERRNQPFSFRQIAITLPAMIVLGLIRTPMLMPVIVTAFLLIALIKPTPQRRFLGFFLFGLMVLVFWEIPTLLAYLRGYEFDYASLIQWVTRGDEVFLSAHTWSERSIGRMFIPGNLWEAILFTPIRMFFYLVAPLPNINIDPAGLVDGNWEDWQSLMSILSAILYIGLFPFAIAAFIRALGNREKRSGLVFQIPFWVTMTAIAGGNQIIHGRYRVMAVLILWGCIWLGWTGDRDRLLRRSYLLWLAILTAGGIFYAVKKFVV